MLQHKINVRFIDSYEFLSTSLEKLALTEHLIVERVFASYADEKLELLLRKGV